MPIFGQRRDTIEWEEYRDDVLFFKWPQNEIKRGSRLIIRSGQNAIFFANGVIEGIFTQEGNFDIVTDIVPFLSSLKGFFTLRRDTGMRAEVYFVNSKELMLPWGTRQRIMIPSPEVPTGIPVGMNGNLVIEFRDYVTFINKVAGVRAKFNLSDVSERIIGVLNPIISECILNGERQIGVNALIALQGNSRALGRKMAEELDTELMDIGLGVRSLNIISINYPAEVQQMAEKVAAQSFIGDVNKFTAVAMADSFGNEGGGGAGAQAMQMAMGMQMAQQMAQPMQQPQQMIQPMQQPQQMAQPVQQAPAAQGDRFCPNCRKMFASNFCPECGTQTV